MLLEKFLAIIGDFFAHVFRGAKRTWKQVSPKVQDALLYGSGVVDTINNNLDAAPDFIFELVQKAFPSFTKEHLHNVLKEAGTDLGIGQELINSTSTEDAIAIIQKFLNGKEGTVWAKISKFLAEGIALATAPGTKVAIVGSLMEFVYQTFFKKR